MMPYFSRWREGTWHYEAPAGDYTRRMACSAAKERGRRGAASRPGTRTRASACSHRSSMFISSSGGGARSSDTTGFFCPVAERLDRKPMLVDAHVDPAVRCATCIVCVFAAQMNQGTGECAYWWSFAEHAFMHRPDVAKPPALDPVTLVHESSADCKAQELVNICKRWTGACTAAPGVVLTSHLSRQRVGSSLACQAWCRPPLMHSSCCRV